MQQLNLANLKNVRQIIFRKSDSAFQLITAEGEPIAMSLMSNDRWAPGFTGDCAFNFMIGVITASTGFHFSAVDTGSPNYLTLHLDSTRPLRRQ